MKSVGGQGWGEQETRTWDHTEPPQAGACCSSLSWRSAGTDGSEGHPLGGDQFLHHLYRLHKASQVQRKLSGATNCESGMKWLCQSAQHPSDECTWSDEASSNDCLTSYKLQFQSLLTAAHPKALVCLVLWGLCPQSKFCFTRIPLAQLRAETTPETIF